MNRKEFLALVSLPVLAAACRHEKVEMPPAPTLVLEADLRQELLAIGSYKINTIVGVFVRRKTTGNAPQDFECYWMICTHARCVVQYKHLEEKFICPCHGSIFSKKGEVLQGPAADPLKQQVVEVTQLILRVYS